MTDLGLFANTTFVGVFALGCILLSFAFKYTRYVLDSRKRSALSTIASPSAEDSSHPLTCFSGGFSKADPRKKNKLGEDAWFVRGNFFGIADGVGGWREHGIDSGKFSRALMDRCASIALESSYINKTDAATFSTKFKGRKSSCPAQSKETSFLVPSSSASSTGKDLLKPDVVVQRAFSLVFEEGKQLFAKFASGDIHESDVIQGSSTSLVARIVQKSKSASAILEVSNVGDCELLVLRPVFSHGGLLSLFRKTSPIFTGYRVVGHVEAGTHGFNMPHQIGLQIRKLGLANNYLARKSLPRDIRNMNNNAKSEKYQRMSYLPIDSNNNLDCQYFDVKAGDIVLAASDGLWDNLFQHEIISVINRHTSIDSNGMPFLNCGPSSLSEKIVKLAMKLAKNPQRISPFAKKHGAKFGVETRGGKLDDTTVVVACVSHLCSTES